MGGPCNWKKKEFIYIGTVERSISYSTRCSKFFPLRSRIDPSSIQSHILDKEGKGREGSLTYLKMAKEGEKDKEGEGRGERRKKEEGGREGKRRNGRGVGRENVPCL